MQTGAGFLHWHPRKVGAGETATLAGNPPFVAGKRGKTGDLLAIHPSIRRNDRLAR